MIGCFGLGWGVEGTGLVCSGDWWCMIELSGCLCVGFSGVGGKGRGGGCGFLCIECRGVVVGSWEGYRLSIVDA